jgi:uncharacterized low-complexity protein
MRRAIAATVMGGLLLGGAVATPAVAAARGDGNVPGKARSAGPAKPPAGGKAGPSRVGKAATSKAATGKAVTGKPGSKKAGPVMKTVAYAGYEFQVPASWPVYRLDEHPRTCVRYDVHAVYLGRPGPDMRCAAGLIGRAQTVSLIPGRGVTAGSAAPGADRSAAAAGGTVLPSDIVLQRVAAVHAAITQNSVNHELKVALGPSRPSATVLGTYGSDPAVVQQVLNTLRLAPAGTTPTGQSASAPPAGTAAETSRRANLSEKTARLAPQRASASTVTAPSNQPMGEPVPPNPTSTSWPGLPDNWPVEVVQPTPAPPSPPKPSPAPFHPVSGFDTCTAPSTSAMRAWRSQYAAVGVYIGGVNAACAYGNLSAGWVMSAASMGWGLLPTYVGPQAPCWGAGNGVLINPASAVAQGSAAALDAVGDARSLRLPAGSPIYYDMEAYNGGSSCTNAVLRFLGAWDRLVQAAGYVSAVYSSQDSGIVDMQSGAVKKTPGFTPPSAIWIALWDKVASLNDGRLTWPLSARSKQYEGSVNATIGGVTLNIDRDFVGGPLAHLPSGDRNAGEAEGSRPNQFARTAVDS